MLQSILKRVSIHSQRTSTILRRMTTSSSQLSQSYLAERNAPVIMLSAASFFKQLTEKEKLYAHYLVKAAHAGTRVVLRQVSHESESIFDMLLSIHKAMAGRYQESEANTLFLEYTSQFLSNLGNFNSFGDTKFVPRCTPEHFLSLLEEAGLDKTAKPATEGCPFATYQELVEVGVYHVDAKSAMLGFPDVGHTTAYYFNGVSKADMQLLQKEVFAAHDIMPENVRVKKGDDGNFVILVASAEDKAAENYPTTPIQLSDGHTAEFQFGDHKREMKMIAGYLAKAGEYAANETQRKMIEQYVKHFTTGDMKAHKESQKLWVKDLAPIIETNTGFIETYRDPAGIIGEYESLVAISNKEQTKKFAAMVSAAEKFLSLLPWGPEYEKPKFQPPDFTSLEVLAFAGSGIPSGINIPNYDDVRINVGFKNVSLGNIVSASTKTQKPTFLSDADGELFNKYQVDSFEVQVGIHELLGHGSGKLLSELQDGSFNFDRTNPPLGVNGEPVSTYYGKGETWGSKFGQLAGPFEECRAEVIAMYLITNRELLSIFGFTTKEEQDNIIYTSHLLMVRAGLMALDFWDPATKNWGQPHMQARFSIMKTFLEYSPNKDLLKLTYSKPDFDDLKIELRRDLVETAGHEAMKDYLRHLHIYKASGDVENGSNYFVDRSTVTPELAKFRDVVRKKKLPRRQFIQANTFLEHEGQVSLQEYEPTFEGMIKSFVEREY
ncbi:AaceriAER229Cp [[Ashbya] aceris (nom. inval.)]|nr:AaceriAER229Cp [[Ashbya] aceris (nom. inval.)]